MTDKPSYHPTVIAQNWEKTMRDLQDMADFKGFYDKPRDVVQETVSTCDKILVCISKIQKEFAEIREIIEREANK